MEAIDRIADRLKELGVIRLEATFDDEGDWTVTVIHEELADSISTTGEDGSLYKALKAAQLRLTNALGRP